MGRIFDFNHKDFSRNCRSRQEFLKENHALPITQEQYVKAVHNMPKHLHWSRTHSPSHSKYTYERLVKLFGFFPGGQDEV